QAKDPRVKVSSNKVSFLDVKEKYGGRFSIGYPDEGLFDVVILKFLPCSEGVQKYYGNDWYHDGPEQSELLDFSPDFRNQSKILWNRTNPLSNKGGRGRMRHNVWEMLHVTQSDNGFYYFRKQDGTVLQTVQLSVEGHEKQQDVTVNGRLFIEYPGSGDSWTLTFTSFKYNDAITLVKAGNLAKGKSTLRHRLVRIQVYPDGIEIDHVETADSGKYNLIDSQGNVAKTVWVDVNYGIASTFVYVGITVGIILVVIVCCCCVKKCCCKKSSTKRDESAPQTAAATAVYYHNVDQPGVFYAAPSRNYSDQPVVSPAPATTSSGPSREYGKEFKILLLSTAQYIEFEHMDSSGEALIVWNRDDPLDSRRKVEGIYFVIKQLTQLDSGLYVVKDKKGHRLSSESLKVHEKKMTLKRSVAEDFSVGFDLEPNSCNIYFFPEEDDEEHTVARRGVHLETHYCQGLTLFEPCGLENSDLEMSCSGRFEFRDLNGNKALVVTLIMESFTFEREYGAEFKIPLQSKAQYIEFEHMDSFHTVTVWERGDPPDSRRKVEGYYYVIKQVTQLDSGLYEVKDKRGIILYSKSLKVHEKKMTLERSIGEDFTASFDLEPNSCNIYFFPEEDDEEHTVARRGVHLETHYCQGLTLFEPCGLENNDLEMSCSGRFEFRDLNGNKALVVTLIMESPPFNILYIGIGVGIISAVLSCCCCLKRTCCRKSSKKDQSETPNADEPAVYYHEVSPSAQQEDVPTVPVPSDPEPRFEVKGLTFPSAPPLSSDSTGSDVYTSDKLNFL
ncbi:hypothetical protein GBF38_008142, partial [Nibea albiflora]